MIDINVQRYISPDEIQKQFADCSAKLIITDHINYSKCQDVRERLGRELPIIVLRTIRDAVLPEGGIDLMELFESKNTGDFQPAVINMDDVTILPYSSGTTGHPKGVILTHRTLVSNLVQISHPETLLYKPTTCLFHFVFITTTWMNRIFLMVELCVRVPSRHSLGHSAYVPYLWADDRHLLRLERRMPFDCSSQIQSSSLRSKYGFKKGTTTSFLLSLRILGFKFFVLCFLSQVNILYVVPPIIKLLSHKAVAKKYLSRLEFVINAAAPMNLPTAYKFLEKAPHVTLAQGVALLCLLISTLSYN